jgi:hypothetical protein
MAVLNLIIENHGGNNCTLLHMGKRALQQLAKLPVSLPVTPIAKGKQLVMSAIFVVLTGIVCAL